MPFNVVYAVMTITEWRRKRLSINVSWGQIFSPILEVEFFTSLVVHSLKSLNLMC